MHYKTLLLCNVNPDDFNVEGKIDSIMERFCDGCLDYKKEFFSYEKDEKEFFESGEMKVKKFKTIDGQLLDSDCELAKTEVLYDDIQNYKDTPIMWIRDENNELHFYLLKNKNEFGEQVEIPAKDFYPTLRDYLKFCDENYEEDLDEYGYYYNPDGLYDWFEIGGRYSEGIKSKKDGKDYTVLKASDVDLTEIYTYYFYKEGDESYTCDKKGDTPEIKEAIAKEIKENPDMYLYVLDLHN